MACVNTHTYTSADGPRVRHAVEKYHLSGVTARDTSTNPGIVPFLPTSELILLYMHHGMGVEVPELVVYCIAQLDPIQFKLFQEE